MLREHLSQAHNAASRRSAIIDAQVSWIEAQSASTHSRILDLGCGTGLYLLRLARSGHTVRGIDFSPASVAYANDAAMREGVGIDVVEGDLRMTAFEGPHDLAMFLFGEFNVFKPRQATEILKRISQSLAPGGRVLLEVSTPEGVRAKVRPPSWYSAPAGLWSDAPHIVLQEAIWDETSQTCVTRYFVVDAASGGVRKFGATYQAYSEAEISDLLVQSGFADVEVAESWDPGESGLQSYVATRALA